MARGQRSGTDILHAHSSYDQSASLINHPITVMTVCGSVPIKEPEDEEGRPSSAHSVHIKQQQDDEQDTASAASRSAPLSLHPSEGV